MRASTLAMFMTLHGGCKIPDRQEQSVESKRLLLCRDPHGVAFLSGAGRALR